jgi:hypothetical protein
MEVRDVLLTHVVATVVVLFLSVRFRPICRTDAVLTVTAVGSPLMFLWLAGRWHLLSVWMRPMLILALLGVMMLTWRRSRRLPTYSSRGARTWIGRGVKVAVVLFIWVRTAEALLGRLVRDEAVMLQFPMRDGRFYVGQGGSTAAVNHHVISRTQQYALDIVKLTGWGNRASQFQPIDLWHYASYGVSVYAPCSGRVQYAEASLPDNKIGGERDRGRPAGNQILVRCDGTDVDVLLAHLQAASVRVAKGEHLEAGRLVGAIGNSGNSTEPHLHIHAKRGGGTETGQEGVGVPIFFDGRFLVRNDTINGSR